MLKKIAEISKGKHSKGLPPKVWIFDLFVFVLFKCTFRNVGHTLGADLYLASVAKHQKGVEQAATYFAAKAAKHRLPILMVNCVGECDNFLSAGQTAVWNRKGQCLAKMDATSEGLLIYDTLTESVQIEQ